MNFARMISTAQRIGDCVVSFPIEHLHELEAQVAAAGNIQIRFLVCGPDQVTAELLRI